MFASPQVVGWRKRNKCTNNDTKNKLHFKYTIYDIDYIGYVLVTELGFRAIQH